MKRIGISARIPAELNDKLENLVSEVQNKTTVIENIISAYFDGETEKNDQKEEVIKDLQEQILVLKEQLNYFVNSCICFDVNKLDIETLAFWLEVQQKAKARSTEFTMQRIKTLFKNVYGEIEEKYITQAKNIKNR